MLILSLLRYALLWAVILGSARFAWMSSAAATAYDHRVPWGVMSCALAWAVGQFLVAGLRRLDRERWQSLDATRQALAALVTVLCIAALSHVEGHVSIRVLRDEAAPLTRWLYLLVCALTPLWLSLSARTASAGWQLLLIAIAATSLSGALLFVPAPFAVGLALTALAFQLDPQHLRLPRRPALLALLVFLLLVGAASFLGHSPLAARTALLWVLAFSVLAFALAMQARDERAWRQVTGTLVATAAVMAGCAALVTAFLAEEIALEPALRTRLYLFRQHPNFLAPFFGSHALLAVGLGLTARRWLGRALWLLVALLLMACTRMTGSMTGLASMLGALAALLVLLLVARRARHLAFGRRFALAGLLIVLLSGATLLLAGDRLQDFVEARMGRFAASKDFRADAWRNSLSVIAQHPWLGVGPETFLALERFSPGSRYFNAPEAPHPHNVFLYVAQSAGLPALVLALGWITAMLLALWRRALLAARLGPAPPGSTPSLVLPIALLAGSLCLLAAGLADLGMSQLTLLPAPLFLFAGLTCSASPSSESRRVPLRAWLWAGGLVVCFIPFALQPLRALGALQQARLLSYEAGLRGNDAVLQAKSRAAAQRALSLDPATPEAHELLARWLESTPGGFGPARDVLLDLIALAPGDGKSHGVLAQLYLRNGMMNEALTELERALADPQGSPKTNRDRADRIWCLAQLGRRDEALQALVDALYLGAGVLAEIRWMPPAAPHYRIAMSGSTRERPLELIEALDILFARRVTEQLAGLPVGRAFWMDTYRSFRVAGRDDRAAAVLDWLEAHPESLVENWTIAAERGELALSAGDEKLAVELFERAASLSNNAYYLQRVAEAQRTLVPAADALQTARAALARGSEILDLPTAFHENLLSQAQAELGQQRPGAAAALLRRTLLFHDDLLERARLLLRIAELHREAGEHGLALDAGREALQLLAAKPYPWASLVEGLTDSLPARLCRLMTASWSDLGYDAERQQREAWSLPQYFSARESPSLFRLRLAASLGRVDHLLREAELRLLDDQYHLPALWARLQALEASGRHFELAGAMRDLAERYGRVESAHVQFERRVEAMRARLDDPQTLNDPEAWRELALLNLLRGRYADAHGLFESARGLLEDDPEREAEVCGWQATAAFLAGRPTLAREALQRAVSLLPQDALLALRLSVIPPDVIDTPLGAEAPR
ncbi:MAG: O-antigen ligase family protein [Planctomycetota bacterium]